MKRILVVDDETLIREILIDYLSNYCKCDQAENGKIAFEKYLQAIEDGRPYELIFLDIYMPIMDGHDLLKSIRQKEKLLSISLENRIKAIVISTGSTPRIVADTFFEDMCDDYIIKPFKLDSLSDILKKYSLI
jgi:two-component system chemotaxis response regulator CheY